MTTDVPDVSGDAGASFESEALDRAPLGVMIADATRESDPIVYANEAFGELTGYDPEEVRGRSCHFLHGEATDESAIAALREAVAAGEGTTVELVSYRADGSSFLNRLTIEPIRDRDGEVTHLLGFHRHAADREERARERREVRAVVEQGLDALEEIFYMLDPAGRLSRWNDTLVAVTGYDEETIAEMRPAEFFVEEHRERIADSIAEAYETGSATVRANVLTTDGDEVPYEFTGSRLDAPDGTLVGLVGTGRDISDRLAYERKLERQNEQLEEFASIVSHDLRNPLNVARGNLSILQEEIESEHLEEVAVAHERMDTLVADLLTLVEDGEMATDPQWLRFESVIEACWQVVDTRDASLTIEGEGQVRADERRLKQLIENLLRNAIDHGGREVSIRIGLLPDGSGFYVADDGPGVPEADRGTVFDRGFTTDEEGIGMGLSIVEQVAEAHDWEVSVTGAESGGARFEITGVEIRD